MSCEFYFILLSRNRRHGAGLYGGSAEGLYSGSIRFQSRPAYSLTGSFLGVVSLLANAAVVS
jgi:hypothetical protein